MFLSKSDFKVAQTCATKLFYKKLRYPSVKDSDEYLRLLAEGGFMIEKMAKLLFSEGIELGFGGRSEESARDTIRALQTGDGTFFEATFISGHKLARTDILRKRGNDLELIEVKSTSYDSDEHNPAVAEGRPNLFRSMRDHSILSGWREYLEDVAFQVLVLKEVFPDAQIRPFLMMPDKAKTTHIDRLYSQFDLRRVRAPGSTFERLVVDFTGDADALREDHFLTCVSVAPEVDLLIDEVRTKAERYAASLHPEPRKIAVPLSVGCRGCEFRATDTDPRDGFLECWGQMADAKPHLLELYHIGTAGGRESPIANDLIDAGKVSLFDILESDLVKGPAPSARTKPCSTAWSATIP